MMKKTFYLLIVMIILLGMVPVPAAAKKGTGMYIPEITGSGGTGVDKNRFTIFVPVVDTEGNPVANAKVVASTDGNPKTATAYTGADGVALFLIYTYAFSLEFTVENVVKPGYIYLPAQSDTYIYLYLFVP